MPSRVANFYVYILSSDAGILYLGITSNLQRRVFEHRSKVIPGFTRQYGVTKLVYFERFDSAPVAIEREKQLKGWRRKNKKI
ncbi:MAG TPA: GIY-YIG nuclease family protein [Candidatus Binataceae bacterium]